MSEINKNHSEDPEAVIESAIASTETYIEKNSKKMLIGLGTVAIVVLGFFGYKIFVVEPREDSAAAEVFVAEQMFAADSFAVALNGSLEFKGFLDVADEYSSTAVGNIANHYAGVCYAQLGEWENALSSLKKYKSVKGIASEIINAQNIGLQGDMLVQLGKNEEALAKFKSAASASSNDFTAPMYLKKAGEIASKLGDKAQALELYKKVKIDYPYSLEGRDIDKYIGKVSF